MAIAVTSASKGSEGFIEVPISRRLGHECCVARSTCQPGLGLTSPCCSASRNTHTHIHTQVCFLEYLHAYLPLFSISLTFFYFSTFQHFTNTTKTNKQSHLNTHSVCISNYSIKQSHFYALTYLSNQWRHADHRSYMAYHMTLANKQRTLIGKE